MQENINKNIVQKAVALKYDINKDNAPKITAKGKGETASNIIKIAKEKNIPIKKDEDLIELLSQIDIDKEIPDSMYKAVAEIFSFIYDLSNKEIIAKDGELKEKLLTQADSYMDKNRDNIISKTIKWETNSIVNNFLEKNISVFYSDAKALKINSMACFPIKKFNKVVGTLAIYSNELGFFDEEVEILFDKLISDVTHCLEKIDYEEIRLVQENELRLSSYAFESSEPMLITNEIGDIVKVNQAFCNTMGYSKDEIIGKNPRIFKSIHFDKSFRETLSSSLKIKGF